MRLQRRFKEGRAAARRAGGVAGLYWKCRHPLERKRKELAVPDEQLDNDKTGNRALMTVNCKSGGGTHQSYYGVAETVGKGNVKATRGSEPATGHILMV